MTAAQSVMVINIFKSNHVIYRMEMGQEFLNPGLNPGIKDEGNVHKLTSTLCGRTQ